MMYEFDGGPFGRCFIESYTSGLHGFARPKMFKVTSAEGRFAAAHTFQFSDKAPAGVSHAAPPTNATLCRIAIAQFRVATNDPNHATVAALDLALAPFDGPMVNGRGTVLTGPGFMPLPDKAATRARAPLKIAAGPQDHAPAAATSAAGPADLPPS